MRTSVAWMNEYIDPPADAQTQAAALTACGFPFEGQVDLENGDVQQEIEMASNRGDCVCHAGLAREIAAITKRAFQPPSARFEADGDPIGDVLKVKNHEPGLCPLYTAQLISGVKVGPSPPWLQTRIRAIGQIPRNNLVDLTNFVLFESGQPTHVFDRALLEGDTIHIRRAKAGESFLPIGEDASSVKLDESDLVIADASRAIAIAGVKGGAETAVTETTTDILVEAAAFDPVTVRNTSRRLGISSDSSYRFERGVHPAEVAASSDRLVALILEIAGGTLHAGVAADGAPIPPPREVSMRPSRCRSLLGHEIDDEEMVQRLSSLEFQPDLQGDCINCTVPPRRIDVTAEIDLIEEVARAHGLEHLEVDDTIEVMVTPQKGEQKALENIREKLVGAGFVETISHSLISERAADGFLDEGRTCLRVRDDRASGEPLLRPSVLPSLLQVAQRNRDRSGATIRAFEIAAIFDDSPTGHRERGVLGMILDGKADTDPATSYRVLRGCVEDLAVMLLGAGNTMEFPPPADSDSDCAWLQPRALVTLSGEQIGHVGMIHPDFASRFDAHGPIAAAELTLKTLLDSYPPHIEAEALAAFPPIDRDISIVLEESITWSQVEEVVSETGGEQLEDLSYVTTWRGKQLGAGHKSVTLRLRFRDSERTLRHEEVDPQVTAISDALALKIGGEIRS